MAYIIQGPAIDKKAIVKLDTFINVNTNPITIKNIEQNLSIFS
ncbi:hypothetical protein EFL1_28800 [Enterococcus faecium]|nr:hypothetical protein EFL1_28800 [Enterococcus faecium]